MGSESFLQSETLESRKSLRPHFSFFFWRPARVLALIGTLLAIEALPFFEPFVATGLATLFNEGSSILWGMVLALAYWSPLAQRFAGSS